MKICVKCQKEFPSWVTIEGKPRNLCSRKYCLDCSPFGSHNTKNLTNAKKERRGFFWQIEKSELKKVIGDSKTFLEVISHFGFSHRGNFRSLKASCKEDGIDLSSLSERREKHLREGRKKNGFQSQYSLDEILVPSSSYLNRGHLKKRLLTEGLLREECYACNQKPEWKGKLLILVLDHINGVSNDNRLENLRLLCPNCNSQMETFAGRNNRRFCSGCTRRISKGNKSGLCRGCVSRRSAAQRPSKCPPQEELVELRKEHSRESVGRIFGVTGNAVKKWEKKLGIIL